MKRSQQKRIKAIDHAAMATISFLASIALGTCAARAVLSEMPIGGWGLLTLALVALVFAASLGFESWRLSRVAKNEKKSEENRAIRHPQHLIK